ncbi:hypothetical protein [Clostridium sp.]|uniref:hypothetical protein n=1 Tax=Clostridium sp. TaxID=1506 RepID=UPI001D7ABEF8|nr:hypothetical protein [Clostridium sp.]MBS5307680.1 hypothetical protein [Clostridium sp.]
MAKERMFDRGRFVFIGEPVFGRDNVVTTAKLNSKSEWSRTRLNFGVKVGNNTQFLNTEYIHSDKIKTVKLFDKEGNGFEVKLDDTANPMHLDKVGDFSKITVNLETDKEVKKQYYSLLFRRRNHEIKADKTTEDEDKIKEYTEQLKEFSSNVVQFVHIKDFIKFINSNQEVIKGNKIKVTGDVKSNYYNGKNRLQFIPSSVEFAPEDSKEELTVHLDIFFDRDSIDDDKKEKKMYINGYIGERIKKADKLIPTQIIFDYSKANLEDENQNNLVEFVKGFFNVKNKKVLHRLPVICQVINGAEVVEFDESHLTKTQKTAIALGLNTLEDFKPKGNVFGDRINFIRLLQPDLKVATDGAIESIDVEDLYNYLLEDDSDKSIEDVKNNDNEESKKEEQSNDDLMKALFGV